MDESFSEIHTGFTCLFSKFDKNDDHEVLGGIDLA